MIRALRLWLLGASAEGPPLLADPLYRYEARSYWTPRRYAVTAVALVLWVAVVALWLATGMFASQGQEFPLTFTVWLALLGRMPLTFMASTGAALCIAPERSSGQLEQFVLTPVDSWRFCLARLAGRLRGPFILALALMPALLAIALLVGAQYWRQSPQVWGPLRDSGPEGLLLPVVVILFGLVDLPAMLLVDAAVGMRFTATCSHPAMALTKTYLVNFLLTPTSMLLGAAMGSFVGMVLVRTMTDDFPGPAAVVLICATTLAARLGLAAIAVRLALRDARVAIQRTFYEPEDRA